MSIASSSKKICPESGLYNLKSKWDRVDFPLPLWPTCELECQTAKWCSSSIRSEFMRQWWPTYNGNTGATLNSKCNVFQSFLRTCGLTSILITKGHPTKLNFLGYEDQKVDQTMRACEKAANSSRKVGRRKAVLALLTLTDVFDILEFVELLSTGNSLRRRSRYSPVLLETSWW